MKIDSKTIIDNRRGINVAAWFFEATVLCVVFLIVDAVVIQYIFPGYFDPFWPHHSDHYIAAAIAYSPLGFWQFLSCPRPVGQIFFWFIGHLGVRGSMAAVLLVVTINYALVTMVMRRLFDAQLDLKFLLSATLFAYLLASHPYQYQFSIWDAFSQLSLLLLLLAIALRVRGGPWWPSALLVLLAFFAKETFVLSVILLAIVWFVSQRFRRISLAPIVVVGGAGFLALVAEHFLSSPFTDISSLSGGPYEIVLTVHSIAAQWLQYAMEGMSWLGLVVVILTIFAVGAAFGIRSKEFLWTVALPIAGLLSWLPNSLLPNHHFAAYSWNGAYMIYAPVIVLAMLNSGNFLVKLVSSVIVVAAICSPALSASEFASQQWVVMNQKRQKQLLLSINDLIKQLPGEGRTVLISGLSSAFTPFEYKSAIRSIKKPPNTKFIVVRYYEYPTVSFTNLLNNAEDAVTMIRPEDVSRVKFDEAWLFRADGTRIERIMRQHSSWSEDGFTQVDTLKFPELADLFGPEKRESSGKLDGYRYLSCGVKLLEYNALESAEKCLKTSSSLLPDNPYPYYYLGVSLEKQKKIEEAKKAYGAAVSVQDSSPNPIFQMALGKLR